MSSRYRVVLSATDGAGGLIHPVWHGRAKSKEDAASQACGDGKEYGWSKVVIISVAHEAPKHPVMGAA